MIDVSREGWVKTDALQCKDSSPEILPRFLPRSFFSKFNETPISSARGRGKRKGANETRGRCAPLGGFSSRYAAQGVEQ